MGKGGIGGLIGGALGAVASVATGGAAAPLVLGGGLLGSSIGGQADAASAAKSAANVQASSAQTAIDEQRRQFEATQASQAAERDRIAALLSPYVNAGNTALQQQQNLIGLGGNAAQQAAIDAIKNGAQYNTMVQTGENAILQNAAATGGLRGGNTQAALAQYSPAILSDLINQQYSQLGGIASMGQNAAGAQANAGLSSANLMAQLGQQSASNIGNLYNQQGSAIAGGKLAAGNQANSTLGNISSLLGTYQGLGGTFGGLFNSGSVNPLESLSKGSSVLGGGYVNPYGGTQVF